MKQFPLTSRHGLAFTAALVLLASASLDTAAQAQEQAPAQLDARFRVAMEAAFGRADVNHDGQLSRQEAEHFPAIAARFDALDQDKDSLLSLVEFEAGYTASS